MRWFLGLLLVIALVGGALYGVGHFILPNSLEVTRSMSIERPRASVFAMINDLRITKEWSPYYARDPDAEYAFSGEPGQGQSMRWVSTVREVGRGRMSIVESIEYEQVQSILQMGDRATLNSRIDLRRIEGGTSASWTVTAECGQGWINVPCRYMNLIMRGMIQNELDSALTRLKTLTEQLPNVDFEGLDPQFGTFEPQPFVYSVVETSATDSAEVARAEELGLNQVRSFMSEYQLVRAGPLTRVMLSQDSERISYRVGYPYSGPRPITVVGVQVGETPAGRVMHVMAEGDRRAMQAAYAQMEAYLQAHRIARREGVLPWHLTHDAGSADTPARIEIFMPLQ